MNTKKVFNSKQNNQVINHNHIIKANINIINDENSKINYNNNKDNNNKIEKYMRKNLSYSNLKKENFQNKIKTSNMQNILNINNNKNKNRIISKHSSMKYFKITPIINPIYDRAYFSSKINLQTANNLSKQNIDIDKMIKDVKIEEISTTSRKSQTLNKIENMPIHIMNNINIINNNLVEDKNLKSENIIFMKKRIQSCHKTTLSKAKIKNKMKLEEICNLYIKYNDNNDKDNERNYKQKENIYNNYTTKKYNQNLFNKTNIRRTKGVFNNIRGIRERTNIYNNNMTLKNIKSKNKIKPKTSNIMQRDYNYNTTNNNIYIEYNEDGQTDFISFKELNLEDFLLIMQKFNDIKNNIEYIYSFYNLNCVQNYLSTKKILKLNHANNIKLYDLFLFYMGSSFDGLPEKLFQDKKSKYIMHIWTVIFIISIGILFTVSQNVNLTDQCSQDILKLIILQEKIFLIFCDLIIQKLNKKYKNNIWVGQILQSLQIKSITNISNHIIIMRTLIINSYEIINNLLLEIKNFDNNKNIVIKNNSKFLYNNFYNAEWKNLNEIKINQLEDNFKQLIFKSLNTNNISNNSSNSNSIETKTFKKRIIKNNFKRDYQTNTNIYKNKNLSPEPSSRKNVLNISNKNQSKTILKNSNSNPSLLRKTDNTININPQNYIRSTIIQYELTIPNTPCPNIKPQIPFLNFPPKKLYTLVIDLDETMASFKFTDIKKGIGILYLRPHLENFLEVIKDYYEIIPFTSASKDYADIALDLIEKNERKKYFEFRLYRENTTQFGSKYIKDLSKLGRDLSKVIIVDNFSQCFKLNNENGILISSFFGEDENDKALIELQKVLIKIYYDNDDVRKGIIKFKDDIFNKISKDS